MHKTTSLEEVEMFRGVMGIENTSFRRSAVGIEREREGDSTNNGNEMCYTSNQDVVIVFTKTFNFFLKWNY